MKNFSYYTGRRPVRPAFRGCRALFAEAVHYLLPREHSLNLSFLTQPPKVMLYAKPFCHRLPP